MSPIRIQRPGLECRKYWYRYGDDALDLCDALACFSAGAKISLRDLCRSLGFPGKPADIDGSEVERFFNEGRINEIAGYCETDVVSTYLIWLVYEFSRNVDRNRVCSKRGELTGLYKTMLQR
jgi:predicted PolB exonuclease-like 3'-5' exonuclease